MFKLYRHRVLEQNILLKTHYGVPSHDVNKYTFVNCFLHAQVQVPEHPALVLKTFSLNIPNTSNTISIVRTIGLDYGLKCKYYSQKNNIFSTITNLFSNSTISSLSPLPPIILIDNWSSKAPYAELFSILKSHVNIKFILTTNPEVTPNDKIISKIKQFVKIDNCRALHPCHCKTHEFINMRYLKYLNREQRTQYIDAYVKDTFLNTIPIITSISYDLSDLYDVNTGNYKTETICIIHNSVVQHDGKMLVNEEYTRFEACIVEETDIEKKNAFIILVDSMEEYFDYSNIGSNSVMNKLRQFGKKNIVICEKNNRHILKLSEKHLLLEKLHAYASVDSMMYIENESYFSCFIDDYIENSNTHCWHLKPYVTFLDDNLRNLYKGKYSIVKLDIENKKYDWPNSEDESMCSYNPNCNFVLGYNYALMENGEREFREYIRNVNGINKNIQDAINGYIYGKREPCEK